MAVLASVILLAMAGPAAAHRMHLKDLIGETAIQRTVMWSIGVDIMRLSLNLDEQASLTRLREAHGAFGQALPAIREGVEELQDRGMIDGDALAVQLTMVTRRWTDMDRALQPVWDAGTVTIAQAGELIALSRQLGRSIDRIHATLRQATDHNGVITVIGMAIMTTENQRALGQRITGEFLSAALGIDATGDPNDTDSLGQLVTQFDLLLRALQHGDPERGLIPPPTTQLREKLAEVERIWREMIPVLMAAVPGEQVSADRADAIAALGASLLGELDAVRRMLAALVPGGG